MRDIAVFLFDVSGLMAQPWLEGGYQCWCIDMQHPTAFESQGVTKQGSLYKVHFDLSVPWLPPFEKDRIAFVAAFPPCDHLAVSGSRWFRGKGLRKLAHSITLFATAAEFCEWAEAPYLIENPVSAISSHWRKPDYTFSPHDYTAFNESDNYSKRTCLWTGNGFVMPPMARLADLGPPDDRIHRMPPGPDRHNLRSATPLGFARAVYHSNTL